MNVRWSAIGQLGSYKLTSRTYGAEDIAKYLKSIPLSQEVVIELMKNQRFRDELQHLL